MAMNVHSYLQVLDQLLMAQYLGREEPAQMLAANLRDIAAPEAPRRADPRCGAVADPLEGSRTVPHCRRARGHKPATRHRYWGGFGDYTWTA